MLKSLIVALVILAPLPAMADKPCVPGTSLDCPLYTAPATTAAPGPSIDGSVFVPNSQLIVLFGGGTPPNGFIIQAYGAQTCAINDNGPASISNIGTSPGGFIIQSPNPQPGNPYASNNYPIFTTPPGYKPLGPVSIICNESLAIEARAW
jgi:hypothetical protein